MEEFYTPTKIRAEKDLQKVWCGAVSYTHLDVYKRQPIDWGAMGQPPEKAVKMATTVVATVPILILSLIHI